MGPEWTSEHVTQLVVDHLERRRHALRADPERARAEIGRCFRRLRRVAACDADDEEAPASWLTALERELSESLPERFCAHAERMTLREQSDFGLWRGGDLVARCSYVLLSSLVVALFAATDAPAWSKCLAMLAAIATFWLPAAQLAWHRRAYSRALHAIVEEAAGAPLLPEPEPEEMRSLAFRATALPPPRPASSWARTLQERP